MLSALVLQNFRCFAQHRVELRPLTVIVGRNNAGKSTLVEALRLISLVTERFTNIPYKEPPIWSNLPRALRGVMPSSNELYIDFRTIFHRYGEPPARLVAEFTDHSRIEVYIGSEAKLYAVIYGPSGQHCRSKQEAINLSLSRVSILPQIRPLDPEERVLTDDYVRRMSTSALASIHFRNHLRLQHDRFDELNELVESTWPGLRLLSLEGQDSSRFAHF